jgi:hypothetical protein
VRGLNVLRLALQDNSALVQLDLGLVHRLARRGRRPVGLYPCHPRPLKCRAGTLGGLVLALMRSSNDELIGGHGLAVPFPGSCQADMMALTHRV